MIYSMFVYVYIVRYVDRDLKHIDLKVYWRLLKVYL